MTREGRPVDSLQSEIGRYQRGCEVYVRAAYRNCSFACFQGFTASQVLTTSFLKGRVLETMAVIVS